MAFPVVAARNTGRTTTTNTTSHAITLPTGITAGDLLVVVFSSDGAATTSVNTGVSGSNWAKLGQASNGTVVSGSIFWKIAEGGDVLTLTTSAGEQSSHVSLRITGGYTVTGTSANGSSTNSNPPNHSGQDGTQDYLWIATRSGDSTVVATVAPASYADLQTIAAAGTGGASTNTAERSLNAASDDPGTFTSASEQWVSWTLSVSPVVPASPISGIVTGESSVTGTLTGTGALSGAATGASGVTGALTGIGALAGSVAGASGVSGVLGEAAGGAISGSVSGASGVTGTLSGLGRLSGAVAGASGVTGALTGSGRLAGAVSGASAVSGSLGGTGALSGSVSGASGVTGAIREAPTIGPLAGSVTGVSGVAGVLGSFFTELRRGGGSSRRRREQEEWRRLGELLTEQRAQEREARRQREAETAAEKALAEAEAAALRKAERELAVARRLAARAREAAAAVREEREREARVAMMRAEVAVAAAATAALWRVEMDEEEELLLLA